MKLSTTVLLSFAICAHAGQVALNIVDDSYDNVLDLIANERPESVYSGFSLDLDDNRLILFDPSATPVLLTEREKVWCQQNFPNSP